MLIAMRCPVKDNHIDTSKIPLNNYYNKSVLLTIIENREIRNRTICYPYKRAYHSVYTHARLALSFYQRMYKMEEDKKEMAKHPEICCDKGHDKTTNMTIEPENLCSIDTKLILICTTCWKPFGEMPKEVLELYNFTYPRHKISIPLKRGFAWVMFDDKHIDYKRNTQQAEEDNT